RRVIAWLRSCCDGRWGATQSIRRAVQHAQLLFIRRGRGQMQLGARGGFLGAAGELSLWDAQLVQAGGGAQRREPAGKCDWIAANSSPQIGYPFGEAALQRGERVGEQDGVGGAVRDAGEARERL